MEMSTMPNLTTSEVESGTDMAISTSGGGKVVGGSVEIILDFVSEGDVIAEWVVTFILAALVISTASVVSLTFGPVVSMIGTVV